MRAWVVMITTLWAMSAQAEQLTLTSGPQQTSLLELYASEGCSSCPPAEKWLSRLKQDPRLWHELVPVAYAVDYWNNLGWRDPYSDQRWSARQWAYKTAGAVTSVYTPAFVIDGQEWRGWFKRRQLPTSAAKPGILQIDVNHGAIDARFTPAPGHAGPWVLHAAILGFDIKTDIDAGENAGRTLTHDFLVLNQTHSKPSNGQWHLLLPPVEQPKVKKRGLAIWVTRAADLTPVQAAGSWLP